MKKHQGWSIDVVERLKIWEPNAETVKKTDRIGPPRNILVEEQGRNDKKTSNMVDEEWFLANCISTVDHIFGGHLVDVKCTAQKEKDAWEVISPKFFVDIGVHEPEDAGDDEGQNEY